MTMVMKVLDLALLLELAPPAEEPELALPAEEPGGGQQDPLPEEEQIGAMGIMTPLCATQVYHLQIVQGPPPGHHAQSPGHTPPSPGLTPLSPGHTPPSQPLGHPPGHPQPGHPPGQPQGEQPEGCS